MGAYIIITTKITTTKFSFQIVQQTQLYKALYFYRAWMIKSQSIFVCNLMLLIKPKFEFLAMTKQLLPASSSIENNKET